MKLDNSFREKHTWYAIIIIQIFSGITATVFAWYGKDPTLVFTISTSISAGLGLNVKPKEETQKPPINSDQE